MANEVGTPNGALRFLMVSTFYPPYHFGGDAVCVHRLSEALARRGHEVDVIHSVDAFRLQHPDDPRLDFRHHPRVQCHGVESRVPMLSALTAHQLGQPGPYGAEIRRVIEERRPDVIHYHNVSLLGGPRILAEGEAVKLYTSHEYWLVCPTHVLFRFQREACTQRTCLACTLHSRRPPQVWRWTGALAESLQHLDRLLCPSQFTLEQHRRQGIQVPMEVLPHFVPDAEGTISTPPEPERPFFLFVGRLEKLKGAQDLIPLFTEELEADLVVVGEGNYGSALRDLARRCQASVRFLGARHPREIGSLYRQSVALLAPSLCYETFGMTVAEAFAQGTPAIVRQHGALEELITESGAGYAFDSSESCLRAMQRLLGDPQHRAELGVRAKAMARRRFSEDAHLDRYLGLVQELRRKR